MEYRRYPDRYYKHLITMPLIWAVLLPLVLLDVVIEIYHRLCFPIYGLPYVRRASFIKVDRHRLSYLDVRGKFSCAYCGYANGLLNYCVMIAARTEEYWCGIKHEVDVDFVTPIHHDDFIEYGDEVGFQHYENSPEIGPEIVPEIIKER